MGSLTSFPISIKVVGKRIVIAGGGEEARAKARLLVKTCAEILVIAPRIEVDFSGLEVVLLQRLPVAEDFDGAALVFIASDEPEGRLAADFARARKIPVNHVDRPADCDFYTPAIVDRAPLTVAISTEGEAPVLARQVRAAIEALLAPDLGKLATLAGAMRKKVEAALSGPARRRFYEKLLAAPEVKATLDRDGGANAADALLQAELAGEAESGQVWLIGAGPGSEDLLTLRAQRLLQEADVIVHDQLVPEVVVQMGRRDAERFRVGKAKGHHSFTQAQINTILVRLAREGKKVARLKSGDPMVFGRAGEEIAALRKANVPYAIVPGITAALAAAADTATPVTLRKVASGLVMATAHGADNETLRHWVALAGQGITLALYMGKSNTAETAGELIRNGLPATTPVGIVTNAGRTERTMHTGKLADLLATAPNFAEGPAVVLIGTAVAHGDWQGAAALLPPIAEIEVA